jgi:uroporphyrinogen-III synthase
MTSLLGITVVVTRSADGSDSLGNSLELVGATVIRLPTIAIVFPPELIRGTERIVGDLRAGDFEWVVFSSGAGVRAFDNMLARHGVSPADVLGSVKVAGVGVATVAAFEAVARREIDLVPERFTGEDLARSLGEGTGRVLLVRPEEAPRSLVEEVAAGGWSPVELPLYRTVRGEPDPGTVESVRALDFDVVTFTSGSTVRYFVELVGRPAEVGLDEDGKKLVVAIGPSTEAVARELGFRVDAIADPHTTEGVVSAVVGLVGR